MVRFPEFPALRRSGSRHATLFFVFIKEILEGDGRLCQVFRLDLHAFLCFNRLVESVRITSAFHDPSGKGIHDQDFSVPDDVVHIPLHKIMRLDGQEDVVPDIHVLFIGKI